MRAEEEKMKILKPGPWIPWASATRRVVGNAGSYPERCSVQMKNLGATLRVPHLT